MKKQQYILNLLKSGILMFSFLGVYLVDLTCSVDTAFQNTSEWLSENTETQQHVHSHEGGNNHSHSNKSIKKNKKEAGCCKDVTNSFYSILQGETPPSTIKISPDFGIFNHLTFTNLTVFNQEKEVTVSALDKKPFPNILPRLPDIRVVIQSFQV